MRTLINRLVATFVYNAGAILPAASILGRPIHVNLSAFVEGSRWEDEDDDGKPVYESEIRDVEIRIKNPVQVTSE